MKILFKKGVILNIHKLWIINMVKGKIVKNRFLITMSLSYNECDRGFLLYYWKRRLPVVPSCWSGRQWERLEEADKWVWEKEHISLSFFCSNAWGYGIEEMGEDWIDRFWNRRCQMVKGTVGYRGECFVFGKSWPVEKFQHLGKWKVMAQRKCPSTQHLVFRYRFIYGNQHDQYPLRDHWAVQRYRHEKLIHIETGYGEYEEIMQIIGKTETILDIYGMGWYSSSGNYNNWICLVWHQSHYSHANNQKKDRKVFFRTTTTPKN